jgi:hypothetical protein
MKSFDKWLKRKDVKMFGEYFDIPYDSKIVGQSGDKGYGSENPVLDSGNKLPARFDKMKTMYSDLGPSKSGKSQFVGSLKVSPSGIDQQRFVIFLSNLGENDLQNFLKRNGGAAHVAGETMYKKGDSRPMQMTAKDILNNIFGECKALLQHNLFDEKKYKIAELKFTNQIRDMLSKYSNKNNELLDLSLRSIIRDLELKNSVKLNYNVSGRIPTISMD